jgi:hypothetical protein
MGNSKGGKDFISSHRQAGKTGVDLESQASQTALDSVLG